MAWISMGSLQGSRGVHRPISRGLGSRSREQMDKNMNMGNETDSVLKWGCRVPGLDD